MGSRSPAMIHSRAPGRRLYRMMDFPKAGGVLAPLARGPCRRARTPRSSWCEPGTRQASCSPAPPDAEVQTGFEWPEAWLTSSVDSVIQPQRWNKPLPVEIKTKDHDTIRRMQAGMRGPDSTHITQAKVQVALVRHFQGDLWPGLDPVTHGFVYYMSRDDPSITAEYRVDYDEKFFEFGIERLKQWRAMFLEDVLPEIEPGKRTSKFGHPNGWRWSYPPCAWCDFKTTCQLDFREGVEELSNSIGIGRAKLVREDYDPEAARGRVFARWNAKILSQDDSRAA